MAARPALTAQGRVRRVRFGSEWGADLEDNRLSSLCRPTGTHAPSSTNSQRPSMIMRSDLTDTEELTGSNPVRPTSQNLAQDSRTTSPGSLTTSCWVFDHRVVRWNFQRGDGTNPVTTPSARTPEPSAISSPRSSWPGTGQPSTPSTSPTETSRHPAP